MLMRSFVLPCAVVLSTWVASANGATPVVIDVAGALANHAAPGESATTPGDTGFKMGTARSPDGHEITVSSTSLLRDGKPWLPVMGEFHFSRYPQAEWRDELRKMKAGGIDIVSTYVFWIHHEEVEGKFDWSGRRSLHDFAQACADVGLPLFVRCGPWCHGEVRNGGLPEWILPLGRKLRTDDADYMAKVRILYGQIGQQLHGLLWKDGGPVIGIQVENEFRGRGEHLLHLKQLAQESGIDVPIYDRTGWPALTSPVPFGELLPLQGGYPEGFWDRELTAMPGKYWQAFVFTAIRTDVSIATEQLGAREARDEADAHRYPFLTCELGGGMMNSYHRRILIDPNDIASLAMVKVGSGSNLPGYYMYHGGTNPDSPLGTHLNEAQATKHTNYNDLPVMNYDFQAPLGEFGQIRPHYHLLRRMHLFLQDFGPELAGMQPVMPSQKPKGRTDADTLRTSVRSDGKSGFIFVNNYQRQLPMPAKPGLQFEIRLAEGNLRMPVEPITEPITVPANGNFFWPFNLDLGGIKLIYATAQPVCRVADGDTTYVVFARTAGIPAEFEFDDRGVTIDGSQGSVGVAEGGIRIEDVEPSTGAAIRLHRADGRKLCIVLLDEAESLACWKAKFQGRERILLTKAGLTLDGDAIRLRSSNQADLSVGILPALASVTVGGTALKPSPDGLFQRFTLAPAAAKAINASIDKVQEARKLREIRMGAQKAAEEPSDVDFEQAAVWRIKLPPGIAADRHLLLRLNYVGDVARVYHDGKLLTDDFYNGRPMEIGLARYAPDIYQGELLLKIVPLQKSAPIYMATEARPDFGDRASVVELKAIDVIEEVGVELRGK